jgi:D-alanine-D-alanine ligase
VFRRAGICTLDRVQGTSSRSRTEIAGATVAVLYGGRSSEREISSLTGAAVLGALRAREGPSDDRGPARCVAVEIESNGAWTVEGERCAPGTAVSMLPEDTIFFLGLHGGEGENGAVQGFLETCSRRYTGSGVAASALCMDKRSARVVLSAAGLAVAPAETVEARDWRERRGEILRSAARVSIDGWAVKPNGGGSSVGTSIVESAEDLARAIDGALETDDRALVEQRIAGTEATCAVLGNAGGELRALTPIEIVPHAGRFFDWQQKYSDGGAEELCPPRTIGAEDCRKLRELALLAHRAAGCDGYSRADFIVRADGGGPVFLEINTLPGLTARSLLPKAAAADGLSYRDLCLEILGLAVERSSARA